MPVEKAKSLLKMFEIFTRMRKYCGGLSMEETIFNDGGCR